MHRRQLLLGAAFVCGGLLTSGGVGLGNEASPDDRPNIILLMADDLGDGDTGFSGHPVIQTPALDRMAASGIRFTRFYAGGPVCSPTRGTCLTGRHHYRYGVFSASVGYLPAEEITLARIARARGYTTGHFGKWHLGPVSTSGPTMPEHEQDRLRKYCPPWERDYDESFTTECNVPTWNPAETEGYKWVFTLPFWHDGRLAEGNLEGPASRVVMDRALDFIERAAAHRQPFFTTIWFHEPHDPVVAGPRHRAMYREHSEGQQHYYGCITAMDEQIGRLRGRLEELGLAGNTMIWFSSDNGPEGRTGQEGTFRGSTGGLRGRKRSLFEGGLRVPALLEWPGRARAGRVVDTPCSTLDYLPTLAEVVGFTMPDDRPLDGVSLLDLIESRDTRRAAPIPFAFHKADRQGRHGSPTLALVDGRWKLLSDLGGDESLELLFDLEADPGEARDLSSEHPGVAAAMRSRLQSFVTSARRSHAGGDYPTSFEPVNQFPDVPTAEAPAGVEGP